MRLISARWKLIIRGLLGRAAAIDTPCEAVVADEEPVTTVTSPSTEESGGFGTLAGD